MKHSRVGRKPKPIVFYTHPEETQLCPVAALDSYISMAEPWHGEEPKESKLFISYTTPHKPIGKSSIARWIKDILDLSGVDIGTFQAHSVRGAASSN